MNLNDVSNNSCDKQVVESIFAGHKFQNVLALVREFEFSKLTFLFLPSEMPSSLISDLSEAICASISFYPVSLAFSMLSNLTFVLPSICSTLLSSSSSLPYSGRELFAMSKAKLAMETSLEQPSRSCDAMADKCWSTRDRKLESSRRMQ